MNIFLNTRGLNDGLRGCRNDSDITLAFFRRLAAKLDAKFTVIQRYDKEGTEANFLRDLDSAAEECKEDDLYIGHNSSHGTRWRDDDGDEADGFDEAICHWKSGCTVDDKIAEKDKQFNPRVRRFYIHDSCNSEGSHRSWSRSTDDPRVKAKDCGFGPIRKQLGYMERDTRSCCWSGCRSAQSSLDGWYGGDWYGNFTYHLLKAFDSVVKSVGLEKLTPRQVHKTLIAQIRGQDPTLVGPVELLDEPMFGSSVVVPPPPPPVPQNTVTLDYGATTIVLPEGCKEVILVPKLPL